VLEALDVAPPQDPQPRVQVRDLAAGEEARQLPKQPLGWPSHHRHPHVLAGPRAHDHVVVVHALEHGWDLPRWIGAVGVGDDDQLV
jgi:hypothetical protein